MLDTLLAGVIHGNTYALVALGISLIFGVANIVTFAQGSVFAVGGLVGWWLITGLHWPLWQAAIGVVAATAVVGLAINYAAVRPLRKAPPIAALLATYAVAIVLDNASLLVFGADTKNYPDSLPTSNLHIGEFRFGTLDVVIMGVSVAAMLLVGGFLRVTKYGRAVRATAQDHDAAVQMGVPTERIQAIVFMLASGLGGLAGVLVAMYNTTITPSTSGTIATLTGFTAATLGGLGSLPGAVVGGFVLGVAESFGTTWWGNGASNLIIFGVLVLTLWFRPQGLLSRKKLSVASEPLTGTFLGGGRPVVLKKWQVGVLAALGFVAVPLLADDYVLTVGTQIIVYALLGLSLTLVSGLAGQISLGQVGPVAIGAYTTALLTTERHWPFLLALLASGVLAAVLSSIVMAPTWKLSGHYVSIATLGIGSVTVAAILNLDWLTKGPLGITAIPAPTVFGLELFSPRALYVLDSVVLAVVLLVVTVLTRSHLATVWRAVGSDEVALRASGLRPSSYKSLAFAVGAFVAGLAGSLLAVQYTYIDPTIFTTDMSLLALTIIVLGAMNSPFGAIIGAVVLIGGPELLRMASGARMLFYGALLLALILFRPQGIWARKA